VEVAARTVVLTKKAGQFRLLNIQQQENALTKEFLPALGSRQKIKP
jgi:hypothetical protein